MNKFISLTSRIAFLSAMKDSSAILFQYQTSLSLIVKEDWSNDF